jgi:hypothetical protein
MEINGLKSPVLLPLQQVYALDATEFIEIKLFPKI